MMRPFPVPAAAASLVVAQPRAPARARRPAARRRSSARRPRGLRRAVPRRVLADDRSCRDYDEFGDYLLRLGLSWLFLTFLAFLAFSGVVTALSTFFLSDDLRLLLAAPVAARRLFLARFARTVGQASWMVVIFMTPVLLGIGAARCAPPAFYADGGADRRAVRHHSGRGGRGRHAAAGEHVSGAARARHADADGPAVRGGASS